MTRSFYGCYLLVSLGTKNAWTKGRTYIGFTVDPRRRLRQHNGDVSNGATRTVKGRPWEMVMVLYGFPTKTSALQFEWAWQHPEVSKSVRFLASQLGKKNMVGAQGKVRLLFEILHCSPWKYFPFKLQFFSPKSAGYKEGCRSPPQHVEVLMASMENLPDVVDDSDKYLPSGSEREAHATMLNLESSFQVNDRMDDESATHHEGLSTKNQMCSICGSSACDTWLRCSCQSIFHVECLAEAFMDGCQSSTAAFPVRGQCPQCKTVHSWIDILTQIQSTRKWLNRKPKGSKKNAKAKKSKVKKREEHKENGVLSDQDCGKKGKGQKRPRQKLSDKHDNPAQVTNDGNEAYPEGGHVLPSPIPTAAADFVCLLTPTPDVESREGENSIASGESMLLSCDSLEVSAKVQGEERCKMHQANLIDFSEFTPQRSSRHTQLTSLDPKSGKQAEQTGPSSVVNLVTPEAPKCPLESPGPSLVVLSPKDTNIEVNEPPCDAKSRMKGKRSQPRSVSPLPLRERLEQRLRKNRKLEVEESVVHKTSELDGPPGDG